MNIELTEQQINNIKVFLERTTLTPKEIPAYIEIIKALTEIQEKEGD